jgi:hypothetical protein
VACPCQHDDFHQGKPLLDMFEGFNTVHARHFDIQNHHMHQFFFKLFKAFGSTGGCQRVVALFGRSFFAWFVKNVLHHPQALFSFLTIVTIMVLLFHKFNFAASK